jgi:hypothetical protein
LYVITGGKFYRLSPAEVKAKGHEITDHGVDHEVFAALKDLQAKNAVVADLPGENQLGQPASCICVALNLDIFDGALQAKMKAFKPKP